MKWSEHEFKTRNGNESRALQDAAKTALYQAFLGINFEGKYMFQQLDDMIRLRTIFDSDGVRREFQIPDTCLAEEVMLRLNYTYVSRAGVMDNNLMSVIKPVEWNP